MSHKQASRKRSASDEYEGDGGFVEDAPKNKKTKATSAKQATTKTVTKAEDLESSFWEVSRLGAIFA
jgi:hypothetical protein